MDVVVVVVVGKKERELRYVRGEGGGSLASEGRRRIGRVRESESSGGRAGV